MKKILIVFLFLNLFAFENPKIENLMGGDKFKTYNQLLEKIFIKDKYSIEEILSILKNNGLLDLFFKEPQLIHTKFIFINGEKVLDTKVLNDALTSLGYYYFYPSEIINNNSVFTLNMEFKSEHYIDPVSLINEMKSRGCNIIDVSRENDDFSYKFDCNEAKIKEAQILQNENIRYINASGVYWLENNNSNKINIITKKIDYWHPSVWFYDDKLNILNNVKIDKKTINITLDIPAGCKYIKITDIYSGENFKRGIIVKGLK